MTTWYDVYIHNNKLASFLNVFDAVDFMEELETAKNRNVTLKIRKVA